MSNENKTALTAEEIIQDNLKKHKIQHFSSQGLKCVSDCMKVQIVGSLLDLLTPTKEERKDDYNKAQDRGASTNSFK